MKKVLVAVLLLLIAATALGQRPAAKPDEPYTLSVDVDLVLFNVTVHDGKGRLVSGLGEKDFVSREDGKPQEIRVFHPEDIPATVGLVIDNSGSMVTKKAEVIDAALAFAQDSNPLDEVFTVNFNDFVTFGLPSHL